MKRFKGLFAAIVLAAAFAVNALPVGAQSTSSSSLSITPRKNYVIEPGKSVADTVIIRNLDNTNTLNLNLRVVDFTYSDTGGTPKLLLGEDIAQTTWSLKPFLTVPETVTIAPGGTKTVNMNVKIPEGHGAGSYYSAIVYSSGSGEGGNVGLSASGVTLVFTQIPGKVTENLQLKKLGAYIDGIPNSGFRFIDINKPNNIGYTLQNNGNVTEAPVGSIKLKYMFGAEQNIDNINPNSSLALIGQTRTFLACIKLSNQEATIDGSTNNVKSCVEPSLWPGIYTLSLDAFYGQNGNDTQEVTGTAHFIYLPIWFIIAFSALLLVVAFNVWRYTRKFRKWKNHRQPKNK